MICKKCAHKTIFWFMVCYALFLVNLLLKDAPLTWSFIFLLFGMPEFLLLAILPFPIALYKFCKWLHCVENELNCFRSKLVSPSETVIRALIPFIFPLAHFCIFRDQLFLQNETLKKNNLKFQDIPKWELFIIPIFGILVQICPFFYFKSSNTGRIATFAITIVLFASYIKIIRVITANVSTLHSLASATSPTADTSSDFPDASSSTPDAPSADAPCGSAASSELCKSSPASDEPNNDTPSDTSNNELDHDTPDNPQRLA